MTRFHTCSWWAMPLLLAPLALAVASCTDESLPTDVLSEVRRPALAADASLPYRATFVITPELLFPGDAGYPARCPTGPTNASAPATGEGHGTHLGHFTETESTCIDFATLSLTLGEFTFTAANGDQLWGEFEGSASFDPPPPNANLFCTWEITGGTGRFVGAAGAGDCVDSRQLGDGTSLIVFEGWITYVASRRARTAAAVGLVQD